MEYITTACAFITSLSVTKIIENIYSTHRAGLVKQNVKFTFLTFQHLINLKAFIINT